MDIPSGDPWIILAAVAQATERLKIGTAVTPLARRRPQVLANTVATLDQLSGGRVILGAGLGGTTQEFTAFGESGDPRWRSEVLDEALQVVDRLFAGEVVNHTGAHFTVENVSLSPVPVQRPRVPIWVGGESLPALRRAARWDGWVTTGDNESAEMITTPGQLAEKLAYIQYQRSGSTPFDVAMTGVSTPGEHALVHEFAAAGVTWWLESLHGFRGSFDDLLARVRAGPPLS
jgi:alkanesulfonate monooxygenase SsuD/methylene tetrahydromethanopterin reductase-like flavin-dependent oxidoreductase (luciferase family)